MTAAPSPFEQLADEARAAGLRTWIVVKERLASGALEVIARAAGGEAVLQGGAALHFVYGSPRLSAEVVLVGLRAPAVLEACGDDLARAAGARFGCACASRWTLTRAGRLWRGKLSLEVNPARRLVLPIEGYEVPAHAARRHARFGAVEGPAEIVADKVVASADRLARRGTLKLSDLYDLWYLHRGLGAELPEHALVRAKLLDYDQPPRGADLAAAVRAVTPEELGGVLAGLLAARDLAGLRVAEILAVAASVLERYRDVV